MPAEKTLPTITAAQGPTLKDGMNAINYAATLGPTYLVTSTTWAGC
jgi:hypothetical protein